MNLEVGLRALEIEPHSKLVDGLNEFIADLIKWNKVYNLTAIRDPNQILIQHIFDSLSVHPFVTGEHIIDVGTGGGFPGIPLAMLMPEKRFTLLDSNGKKTRFLQQMVINHGLDNCDVVQSRAESFKEDQFDTVVCRAFAALAEIVSYAGHLVSDKGELLAMKGQVQEELQDVPDNFTIVDVHPLKVPNLHAERHLVVMQPNGTRG